jgi:acyl-CoA synthetase (AMP-forming)/AMP-acid ligase II
VEIRDRLKDVIIRGGENISSVEVGAVLLRASYLRVAVDRVRMLEHGFEDTSGKFWIKVIKEQRLKDINAPLLQKALYRQRLTW